MRLQLTHSYTGQDKNLHPGRRPHLRNSWPFPDFLSTWGRGGVTSISLRANKGKDFSPKTKDSYQVHNKDLLSLSIGPGEKQESRRDESGKQTVGGGG